MEEDKKISRVSGTPSIIHFFSPIQAKQGKKRPISNSGSSSNSSDSESSGNSSDESDTVKSGSEGERQPHSEHKSPISSKRKIVRVNHVDDSWKFKNRPWLQKIAEGKYMCAVCMEAYAKTSPANTPWVTIACAAKNVRALSKHSKSKSHHLASNKGGQQLEPLNMFATSMEKNLSAMKCCFSMLYFLAKNAIASNLYPPLRSFISEFSRGLFDPLDSKGNGKYTSSQFYREVLIYLGDSIKRQVYKSLALPFSSQMKGEQVTYDDETAVYYSLIFDTSADNGVVEELCIYVRAIPEATLQVRLLSIVPVATTTAMSITNSVLEAIGKASIPISHVVNVTTDGCSTMLGARNGVVKQLQAYNPLIISQHCCAHRLALASKDASESVDYIAHTFKDALSELFCYFMYQTKRLTHLKFIQEKINPGTNAIRLIQNGDTRWLSYSETAVSVKKILPAIIASLIEDSEGSQGDGKVRALGLAKVLGTQNFVRTLLLWCDLFPCLAKFSKVLQGSHLDFIRCSDSLKALLSEVDNLIESPGMFEREFHDYISKCESSIRSHGAWLSSADVPEDAKVRGNVLHRLENFSFEDGRHRSALSFERMRSQYLAATRDNLNSRFPDMDLLLALGNIFPVNEICASDAQTHGAESLDFVVQFYSRERECPNGQKRILLEPSGVRLEYICFKTYMQKVLLSDLRKTLKREESISFSNMLQFFLKNQMFVTLKELSKLARICLTIAMSSADAERGFSAMSTIKTKRRNRLSPAMLEALMLVRVEGPPVEEMGQQLLPCMAQWYYAKDRRMVLNLPKALVPVGLGVTPKEIVESERSIDDEEDLFL